MHIVKCVYRYTYVICMCVRYLNNFYHKGIKHRCE